MRCLALAQAWQDRGGSAVLVGRTGGAALAGRLGYEGIEVVAPAGELASREDAAALLRLADERDAAWVVVDGYAFDAAYQRRVVDAGRPLLWIDDEGHAAPYCADLVLNQNLHARAGLYRSRSVATRLLLGPRFALLRREFRQLRSKRTQTEPVHSVLVTLGGADPGRISLRVLDALAQLDRDDLRVTVVVGPASPDRAAVEAAAARLPLAVEVVGPVGDMAERMNRTDIAVAAAGSTVWELALLGVPSVLLVVAPNQARSAELLVSDGAALCVGLAGSPEAAAIAAALDRLLTDGKLRAELSRRVRRIVDGGGGQRVCEQLAARPAGSPA
jgi:UDP-2,4-diacetamido-2,4,6-trideoxy-beta-L-altropyranose hydrolase